MEEIHKNRCENEKPRQYRARVAKHIFKRVMALHRPEEMRRLQETIRSRSHRLFSVFAERPDGHQLSDTLRDLLEDCLVQAHYTGFRRGYQIARQKFSSESATAKKAKSAIAKLVEEHPEWKIARLFAELDRRDQPFYRLQTVPKRVRCWSDVAKEPSYKMFVSRVKERMRTEHRVHGWKKLMRRHEELRRRTPPAQT